MNKLKDFFKTALAILAILFVLCGMVFISYTIWRAEHPQAKTWTFFVSSK